MPYKSLRLSTREEMSIQYDDEKLEKGCLEAPKQLVQFPSD